MKLMARALYLAAALIFALTEELHGAHLRFAGPSLVHQGLQNNCTVALSAASTKPTPSEACADCKATAGQDDKCWFWQCGTIDGDLQWCSATSKAGAVSCANLCT
mmetsp:Transcript_64645/g.114963  ORF Transcript_64645/g.114963 Transcript_64645/m.114963 type:complete len:105 (-) Transcript_64645:164-478(-)